MRHNTNPNFKDKDVHCTVNLRKRLGWCSILLSNRELNMSDDDDGQNKFLQINDSKENLSYIIIRMNLIQYKKLKTLALCLGRVLLTEF